MFGKFAVSLFVLALGTGSASARENMQISGSSTVLPYAIIVAELFGDNFDFRTPVVEGGGSGAGRKKLCAGLGDGTIDIANSSSRIKQSDIDECNKNGVSQIMEVRIGYDGIVFASSADRDGFALSPEDVYQAVAEKLAKDGALVANDTVNWRAIDPALPDRDILAFIPGTKHGTREVFDQKVLIAGCKETGAYDLFLAASTGADDDAKKKEAETACSTTRADGRSVDIDGDYTETLARLQANPNALGVFGLSFYENNMDKLKVATVSGVMPSVATIASGEYPVSRPLYFYVKKQHLGVIPGLKDYIQFFVSDDVAGPDGPLADYGLVPDPELKATQTAVAAETVMGPLE